MGAFSSTLQKGNHAALKLGTIDGKTIGETVHEAKNNCKTVLIMYCVTLALSVVCVCTDLFKRNKLPWVSGHR